MGENCRERNWKKNRKYGCLDEWKKKREKKWSGEKKVVDPIEIFFPSHFEKKGSGKPKLDNSTPSDSAIVSYKELSESNSFSFFFNS